MSASCLANTFRNLLTFCINLDTDEMLLLGKKNKGLGIIPLEIFPFEILEKIISVPASYLAK